MSDAVMAGILLIGLVSALFGLLGVVSALLERILSPAELERLIDILAAHQQDPPRSRERDAAALEQLAELGIKFKGREP